jgi:hypothetical protein
VDVSKLEAESSKQLNDMIILRRSDGRLNEVSRNGDRKEGIDLSSINKRV